MNAITSIMESYDETRVDESARTTLSKGCFTWFFGENVCGEYIRITNHSNGRDNVYFINSRENFESFLVDFCSVH